MQYIKRNIEKIIKSYLKDFPVIAITGPRQSGKSTTVQKILTPKYRYVSFDDIENENFFREDPKSFIQLYNRNVIFDEVQYVPDIFRYIKIEVDKNREYYGNFILTGSSNFLMNKHISESLAGRAANINILPLDITEIPEDLLQNSIFQGAYPENVINSYKSWKRWYSNYINLYLQKDIRMMSNIGNMNSFKDFFRLLALRASKVLNLSEISKDLGIVVNTVKNWLSLFEASFITFRLYPYHSNLGKRIIKSPKLYFFDTGIISTLTAINSYELFLNGPLKGEIFENYIVSELFKRNNNLDLGFSMYYYRKSNGDEIDLIIEKDNNIDAIEIKSNSTFRPGYIQNFNKFQKKVNRKYLVYRGVNMEPIGDLHILNYSTFLKNYFI